MREIAVKGRGRLVSFTTLYSAPTGFHSPLHLALVELSGGGRVVCHGGDAGGLRVGVHVAIEKVGDVYYFSSLSIRERALLFWRRTQSRSQRARAIAPAIRSALRRLTRRLGREKRTGKHDEMEE